MRQFQALVLSFSMYLCLVLASPVLADQKETEAEPGQRLLEQAITHFAKGNFDSSLKLLGQAKKGAQNPLILARIHLFIGLNALIHNKQKQAEQSFEIALSYDPLVDLDSNRFKPEFLTVLDRVRNRCSGTITVTANETNTIVFVDGYRKGPLPFSDRFPIGSHTVKIRRASGDLLFKETVLLHANEHRQLAVMLPKNPSSASAPAAVKAKQQDTPSSTTELAQKTKPPKRIWTWVAAGGAFVFLALGVGYTVAAYKNEKDGCAIIDPNNTRDCRPAVPDNLTNDETTRYEDLRQSLTRNRTISYVGWGVGGALAVSAGVLYWVEGRSPASNRNVGSGKKASPYTLRFWAPPTAAAGIGLDAAF
jgi:hypothetical protein